MLKLSLAFVSSVLFLTTAAQTFNNKIFLKVELRDGSIYQGTSNLNNLEVNTSYGKLTIPVNSLNQIVIGLMYDTAKGSRLAEDLKKLKYSLKDEQVDSIINKYKLNVNFALKLLSTYQPNETDMSFSENIGSLTNALNDLYPNLSEDITTDMIDNGADFSNFKCTIRKDNIKSIPLKTAFGQIDVPLTEISSISVSVKSPIGNVFSINEPGYTRYTLYANKNIYGNQDSTKAWAKTSIKLNEGDSFYIKANGKITLSTLDGNAYAPNGIISAKATKDDYLYSSTSKYGKLIFMIANDLTSVGGSYYYEYDVAGDSYAGVADKSGFLYLSIYEILYSPKNTGTYTVYVKSAAKE